MRHWILAYATVGCMPESMSVHRTKKAGAESGALLYDVPKTSLLRDGVVEAEEGSITYVTLEPCECGRPWEHSTDDPIATHFNEVAEAINRTKRGDSIGVYYDLKWIIDSTMEYLEKLYWEA